MKEPAYAGSFCLYHNSGELSVNTLKGAQIKCAEFGNYRLFKEIEYRE